MRLAVASLLGSNVPALVETLRRDVARAGGQRSRLQTVRIACLAARVGRDAAGVHASFHNSAIAERAAQRRERWQRSASAPCWQGGQIAKRGYSPVVLTPAQMLVLVRCYHLDNSGVSTSGLTPG